MRVDAYILLWLMAIGLLVSCNQGVKPENASVLQTTRYEIRNVIKSDTDSLEVRTKAHFPVEHAGLDSFLVDYEVVRKTDSLLTKECDWYCLKSFVGYDTALRCSLYLDFPSTNSWHINATIKKGLNKYKDDFFARLRKIGDNNDPFVIEGVNSDFNARILSAYEDSLHISFCFTISEYPAGAAHGNHFYQSFNFDKRTNEEITFNDLFSIETPQDSSLMCDLVKASVGETGLDLSSVYEYDFNLDAEYIVFNFDSYEIAPYSMGSPRAPLSRRALFARFGRSKDERVKN